MLLFSFVAPAVAKPCGGRCGALGLWLAGGRGSAVVKALGGAQVERILNIFKAPGSRSCGLVSHKGAGTSGRKSWRQHGQADREKRRGDRRYVGGGKQEQIAAPTGSNRTERNKTEVNRTEPS